MNEVEDVKKKVKYFPVFKNTEKVQKCQNCHSHF